MRSGTVLWQVILTLFSAILGAVLTYAVLGLLSILIWPDLKQSNLAGLPAALIGFPLGFAAGLISGWRLSERLSKKGSTALMFACLIALGLFAILVFIASLQGN